MSGLHIPPEAFRLTSDELLSISYYHDKKDVGDIVVSGNETIPTGGWSPDFGDEGVVIPYGSDDCIVMHVTALKGLQQARHDLVLAGSYVALHEQLRDREFVVGVTYKPLAALAVRIAGFTELRPYGSTEEKYQERLAKAFAATQRGKREELCVSMVCMPTTDFIGNFASRRVGRNAAALQAVMFREEF